MTITTTQLRRKVSLADSASKEDIVVTKRGKPFVVIMDDKRYEELIANQREEIIMPKEPRVGWEEKFKEGN